VFDQLAYDMRVNVHLGVVQSINDGGQAQTATVTSHDGFTRADLQVMQPFGFASLPPGDGATGMMFSVGGDAGQFVLLPLCCPSIRFGNLLNGESVMYAADGSRVHIRQGGVINVIAATTILVQVGDTTLTVSATGVAIVGNVTVTGNINATGDVSDGVGALSRLRDHYNPHTHTAPDGVTSTTSEPD
jgi:phage baseplate assembly protein V